MKTKKTKSVKVKGNLPELIRQLKKLSKDDGDNETNHIRADELLLEFIGSKRVTDAFADIGKWYS